MIFAIAAWTMELIRMPETVEIYKTGEHHFHNPVLQILVSRVV